MPRAKPKTKISVRCTLFSLLTVFSILGNIFNSSNLKYRSHSWFVTFSYISHLTQEYILPILLPECVFWNSLTSLLPLPPFSVYFFEVIFVLWRYIYLFLRSKSYLPINGFVLFNVNNPRAAWIPNKIHSLAQLPRPSMLFLLTLVPHLTPISSF